MVSLLATAESRALEYLRTVDGKEFYDISILGVDRHGLSFRHEKGIAKLPFSALPERLRRHYEADSDEPRRTEEELEWEKEWEEEEVCLPSPVLVRARSRVRFPHPSLVPGGGCCPGSSVWPLWWPRYSRVHELTRPYCRALAVRDFLYRSGLLAAPRGMRERVVFR